ncbi:serine/threonine-protein kinase 19 [Galendromus occidentalis]|uniref:Serine/threonine-protein kinase 19 n=1 Tax=Galendromus occidentalis TaxID=34638 RepID=A0AAJ6QTG8_9ACAR|nr:serine/threonine-protein kinase 19 [Galendromus occidentalis]
MCAKRSLPGGGSLGPGKKSRLDVDLVMMKIRQEYNERCSCRKNFKLCTIMQHMLYAYIDNRTLVDRRINELVESGRLRAIRLGIQDEETALVDLEEYVQFCLIKPKNLALMEKFVGMVNLHPSQVYTREELSEVFSEKDVSELVQMGVLTRRNIIGSYWLSVPGIGKFVKSLEKGRKALQLHLRRSKFKQLLRTSLEEKKFSQSNLSSTFLIDDAIGIDAVTVVESTCGAMLRLND